MGGIHQAIKLLRKKWKKRAIEVEVTNQAEIIEALDCKVERLLLDNMTLEEIDSAVKLVNKLQ